MRAATHPVTLQPPCRALLPRPLHQCTARRLQHSRRLAAPERQDQPQQHPPEAPQLQPQQAAAAPDEGQLLAAHKQQLDPAAAVAEQQPEDPSSREQHDPSSGSRATTLLYLAMGVGLSAVGLLAAVYAAPLAASCLKLGSMPLQHAAVLVGCGGAALLRAASLALFLAGGAAAGELGTWRYQRINLGLAACGAITALLHPLSWSGGQPWLLLAVGAAGAAGAAACGSVFVQQWRRGGVQFASAIAYGDWIEGIQAALLYLVRDLSTLAGSLTAGLGVLALGAGLQATAGAGMAAAVPWAASAAAGGVQEAGMHYMRKLLGVGLLLTGLQCWALSEYASGARRITPETAVKLVMLADIEQRELAAGHIPAPVHVSPARFTLLHMGFFAAAVVQGLWLAQAGAAGSGMSGVLGVNGSDPLWPVMYWSVLGSAAYLVSVVGAIDYTVIGRWIVSLGSYLSGWVSAVAALLFVDWMWLTEVRRR